MLCYTVRTYANLHFLCCIFIQQIVLFHIMHFIPFHCVKPDSFMTHQVFSVAVMVVSGMCMEIVLCAKDCTISSVKLNLNCGGQFVL